MFKITLGRPEDAMLVERIRGMIARNDCKRQQAPPIVRGRLGRMNGTWS
jgi:hypothetical protein